MNDILVAVIVGVFTIMMFMIMMFVILKRLGEIRTTLEEAVRESRKAISDDARATLEEAVRESRKAISNDARERVEKSMFVFHYEGIEFVLPQQPQLTDSGKHVLSTVHEESVSSGSSAKRGKKKKKKSTVDSKRFSCVGFFFSEPGMGATANHCLTDKLKKGHEVKVYSVHYKVWLKGVITIRDEVRDVMIIRCKVPSGMPPDPPGNVFLPVNRKVLHCGEDLALCTCTLALTEETAALTGDVHPGMGIMRASLIRYTHAQHHVIYDCPTFSGDCGSALVLYNGEVVGLHVEGVNQLRERISRKKDVDGRLTALEASVDSAIHSTAHGAVAVCLGSYV